MSKRLVAYFSASGVTAKAAANLAKAAWADLYEIKPAVPYTSADLNWNDKKSRSSVEMNDKSSRPKLADYAAPIAEYDTIFWDFLSGGIPPRPLFRHFWKAMILPAEPLFFLPRQAAADWGGRRQSWRTVVPALSSKTESS